MSEEDTAERTIALSQLRESVGKVLGIVLDDVAQKEERAGLNAAQLLNAGAMRCSFVVEWPSTEVHVFVSAEDGSEPQKLCSITMPYEAETH